MRVLVTGGAGFIGSNLVRSLLDGGDDVQSSILAQLIGKGFQVIEYHQRQIDLEEVFMTVTKGDVS